MTDLNHLLTMTREQAEPLLAAMTTPELEALRDRAHQHEMDGWCDGSGATDVTTPHRVWLWCMMELDKRSTVAATKGGQDVMNVLRGV